MYCTIEDVIYFTGIKPKSFRLDADDIEGLNGILEKWIIQCEDLIDAYTHNSFKQTDEIPPAISNVTLRIVANMIALYTARKDTPVIKVNDWTIKIISSEIFTDDLKEDLEPFVIDKSNISDKIDFFAVTGEDLEW